MGGWGWNAKATTESRQRIDIRWLKRQNYLWPGYSGSLSWSNRGEKTGSIGYRIEKNKMILKYRHKPCDGEWEGVEQTIFIDQTSCNYGGQRSWFFCPYCSRRCAVIYCCGKYFACRVCCRLTYQTCNETPMDRKTSKANKLRERIGAKPGAFNHLPIFKPKGMHQSTWARIRNEIQYLEGFVFMDMDKKLDVLRGKCNRIEKKFSEV